MADGAGRWGRPVRCGPFTGERYRGSLRWLRGGDTECVRMMALVVRDRAWRTVDPASLRERVTRNGWVVDGRTAVGASILSWQFAVSARDHGLEARAVMTAYGDVVTNRTGIVVLLPAAAFAGARYAALHSSGATSRGTLPPAIAPHQPMVDVAAVRIAATGGPALELRIEGEIFEMEDQRNWLDPTFKLYTRSLSRTYPYRIPDGVSVEQRVTIDLIRPAVGTRRAAMRSRRGTVPALGVATAPGRVPADRRVAGALREAAPAFIVHRTDASARGLAAAARLARSLDAELRVEAFGDGAALARALAQAKPHTVAPYFAGPRVDRVLQRQRIPRSGGTFADFVMLNRNGVGPGPEPGLTSVTFALCPTVHARDERSLIETLDTLPAVFGQARALAGGRSLDAGPCALFRRLVPQTGKPATRGPDERADYDVHPAQHAPIAAAWLACVIAVAGACGVRALCTYEAAGARGLVRNGAAGSGVVKRSPSHAVLAALARQRGAPIVLHALDAFQGAAFTIQGASPELWLVDLSGRARRWNRPSRRLRPYAIVRLASDGLPARAVHALVRSWCGAEPSR